jgi:6-phosphofructokinase 1
VQKNNGRPSIVPGDVGDTRHLRILETSLCGGAKSHFFYANPTFLIQNSSQNCLLRNLAVFLQCISTLIFNHNCAMPKTLEVNLQEITRFLQSVYPFSEFAESEIQTFAKIVERIEFMPGETVFASGDESGHAYIIESGRLAFDKMGYTIGYYHKGEVLGERRLMDGKPRTATVSAEQRSTLLKFTNSSLENPDLVPQQVSAKLYKNLSRLATSTEREENRLYSEMDVLLVQDGGCAPGYNSVTAYVTEYLETAGRRVFVAGEGFKSLVSGNREDFRCLVYSYSLYRQIEHIHGVIFAPPLREARGADFRTERYKEFIKEENQKKAAENIIDKKVKILVGIGGNGTLAGIKSLVKFLPKEMQIFFIPVTIDSDVQGTECIGQHTGVEVGAEKIRCYMADARTHHRCYIIEMMGASGGFHALHSCLGAGAHLAVLPSSTYEAEKLAKALKHRTSTVIVVAEGYKAKERKEKGVSLNAAEYLYEELKSVKLETRQRVICEGFARDIRGARPNNMDITLSQRMARKLTELVQDGKTQMMPAVLSGKEYAIHFNEIQTDNTVEPELALLANRLGV